jgi:2-oxo-4-hydroxy-4-carboxy-5-ureidoimidazoline decarboxylase
VSAGRRADAIARYLNALTEPDARAALLRCCGSRRWVERMLAGRPFADDATLFTAAERVWWSLEPADCREAFAAHPRIGERAGDAWARAEQAGMAAADTEMRRAFIEGNRAYEERFGHVFLICATGRSADDLATELQRRLGNDPASELRIAAGEVAKITRLRLEKLVTA